MPTGKHDPELRLFPPRPRLSASPASLSQYSGYLVQLKYDDIRVLIQVLPDGRLRLYNRYQRALTQMGLSLSQIRGLRKLDLTPGTMHVLDGGLLRRSIRTGAHPLVLWDILVHEDHFLAGTTYGERYALLRGVTGDPRGWETETGAGLALAIHESVWLAPVFEDSPEEVFRRYSDCPEIEGLVLKDPRGRLERVSQLGDATSAWQVRVRKK